MEKHPKEILDIIDKRPAMILSWISISMFIAFLGLIVVLGQINYSEYLTCGIIWQNSNATKMDSDTDDISKIYRLLRERTAREITGLDLPQPDSLSIGHLNQDYRTLFNKLRFKRHNETAYAEIVKESILISKFLKKIEDWEHKQVVKSYINESVSLSPDRTNLSYKRTCLLLNRNNFPTGFILLAASERSSFKIGTTVKVIAKKDNITISAPYYLGTVVDMSYQPNENGLYSAKMIFDIATSKHNSVTDQKAIKILISQRSFLTYLTRGLINSIKG